MRRLILSAMIAALAACGSNGGAPADPAAAADDTIVSETSAETSAPVIDVTGETCGGIAAIQCPSNFYCEQPVGQCLEIMDGAGTCQSRPQICTREYRPVCGCDGETYPNACEAATAGASVAIEGECASPDTG